MVLQEYELEKLNQESEIVNRNQVYALKSYYDSNLFIYYIVNINHIKRLNYYLVLCCITVSLGSFQFGFNIASLNSPTEVNKFHFLR
jgi:hypothetical protein